MNLDSLSFALSQISYSVANLTKKNYKSNITEISNLVSQYGPEADRHLFRCLFSHVDFSGDGRSGGKDFHQALYLIQECGTLISRPNFVSILCYALDHPLHHQKSLRPSPHLFPQLSRILKLTSVQEVAFGLAALSSLSADTQKHASQFVKQKLPQLLSSYIDSGSGEGGGLRDAPVEVVHLLLSHLLSTTDVENLGVSAEQKEAFFKTLTKDFPRDQVPVVLAPLLYPENSDPTLPKLDPSSLSSSPPTTMGESLADLLLEMGPVCTKSMDQCRNALNQFGVKLLTPASIARVLGMMTRHPSGSADTAALQGLLASSGAGWLDVKDDPIGPGQPGTPWNVEVFISIVKELAPTLNWKEVVRELDHPGFAIMTRPGFELIVQALFFALSNDIPPDVFYSSWKNKEGQLSWISSSLKYPEVFSFVDFPHRPVVTEVLKSLPDEDNRDVVVWKSLDLVDTLLLLSEEGFYTQVLELFKYPVQCCPDLLLLGLLQSMRMNQLKKDLMSMLLPLFLGNHPNAIPVLQFAWHCQNQSTSMRTLVLQAMADWYMRGEPHDQTRLSRILDVAQDLKALSVLLNASPFAFVIDLACLASRREYLKLDKWLNDKIREHGEAFVQACAQFIVARCPQVIGAIKDEQQPVSRSQQLPTETVNTILGCLQAVCPNLTDKALQQEVYQIVTTATLVMKSTKPVMPGMMVSNLGVGNRAPSLPQGQMPGLGTGIGSQIDPSMMLNAVMAGSNPVVGMPSMSGGGVYGPGSLASSLSVAPPGSPAKTFPQQLGPISQQPPLPPSGPTQFGSNLQALSSQLQSLNLHQALGNTGLGPSIGTGLGTGFGPSGLGATGGLTMQAGRVGGGAPSLGMLSSQALAQQQAPAMRPVNQASDLNSIFTATGPTGAVGNVPAVPGITPTGQQFSKEIEDEANSYFQRIYNTSGAGGISIEQVLDMLKTFKDSPNEKDKEVFQCMLRNLFEEYRFFQQYPKKKKVPTATLR